MTKTDKIFNSIEKIPPLSPTVAKIINLANDLNSSPRDLMKVIRMDPVLTAKVLKLINSAYFSISNQIEVSSLNRAVVLLGINTIKNLALSTAVTSTFKKQTYSKFFSMDDIWRHALGCAVGAKIIAIEINIDKKIREEYFIGGLLHDIGVILMVQYLEEDYINLFQALKDNPNKDLLSTERELLGITHPEIGAEIAKRWKLSENLVDTILEHHSPDIDNEPVDLKLAVHLSNYYCHKFNIGFSYPTEKAAPTAIPEAFMSLGFFESQLEQKLGILNQELEKAEIFLKINKETGS